MQHSICARLCEACCIDPGDVASSKLVGDSSSFRTLLQQVVAKLAGLLKGVSNCQHTREPIPAWNTVKVVRTKPTAELVNSTIFLMIHDDGAHLNMPSAPMPIPDTDETSAMHPALVTKLTLSRPHCRQGGLIPHLSREGLFWKSSRPAVHETVPEYQLHLDPNDSEHLSQLEKIPCGWVSPLPKISDYNPTTGLHKSLVIDCVQGNPQYWVTKDGTTAKAASPAGPPSWSGAVQGLTQHFEWMSVRGGTHASEMKSFLDEASDPPVEIHLNHEEVTWDYYTGRYFAVPELVPGVDRHKATKLKLNALGGEFIWTLKGDLYGLQSYDTKETIVLCPFNNTEYLNVAAYLEAFWGYIWPAVCHNNVPPHDEWTSNLHGGLKEFIDHAISVLGRTHLKPTTECLRGVVTYPTGDSTQGRFKMTLSDLQNKHYTVAVREAMMDLILGRSDNSVKVGDVVEMLLSISFGVKDSMLDWTWLGISPKEWPPQRLDWEMYRLEHLAFVSNMEEEMIGWIEHPWHVLYSALRCMACQDWKRPHSCPVCRAVARNPGGTHDAWAYFKGCLTHLATAPKCIGSLLLEDPLNARGNSLIPTVASMIKELSPKKKGRDWLPPLTILYMAPGGHRQWPVSIKPMLDRLSWIVLRTRPLALMHLREALHDRPEWKPLYRQGPRIESVPAVPYKFLDIGTQMGEYHIEELIPKKDDKDNILHPRHTRPGIPSANTFHSVVLNRVGSQYGVVQQLCSESAWFDSSPTCDFWVADASKYRWGLPVLVPTCPKKMFMQGPRLKYIDIVTDTLHAPPPDLITWNTLVMMKLRWFKRDPKTVD